MSASMQEHLKESVFKTALIHFLRNSKKSPERTARNIEELLVKFSPQETGRRLEYDELLQLIKTASLDDCIRFIMNRLS